MNSQTDTTAGAAPTSGEASAATAYAAAYEALQELDVVVRRLRVLTTQVEAHTTDMGFRNGNFLLPEVTGEAVIMFSADAAECARDLTSRVNRVHDLVLTMSRSAGL